MRRNRFPILLGSLLLCSLVSFPVLAGEEESPTGAAISIGVTPKVWIGVRMADVPEALAAHMPQGKFMLINVAKDSPADNAGLERYDVVVSFNGQPITDLDGLLRTIQENGADRPAQLVVIHRGAEKIIEITPRMHDPSEKITYKYEEDDVVQSDPMEKYFGHRLKIGPDGRFIFEPQGRLDMMPEDIKTLLEKMDQFSWQDLDNFDLDDAFQTPSSSINKKSNQRSSVEIRVEGNGETLSIKRDDDGKITVELKDAEGNTKTTGYENEEQFKQDDPEHYRLFERTFKSHRFSALVVPPDFADLNHQQNQFQRDLQGELERLQEQVTKALEEARQAQKQAEQEDQEK